MESLKGKVVFISGAGSGIGRATSVLFAASGARVVLGCRKAGDCKEIIENIIATGGIAKEVDCDMSDLSRVSKLAADIVGAWGQLDIIINNAATISPLASIPEIDLGELDKSIRVNVTAQIALISKVWKALSEKRGYVINILSGASKNPRYGWTAYCSGKAALHMFTKQVSLEGERFGIKSFGFAPGLVKTKMQNEIRKSAINEISFLPESDMISPGEPAKCILLLASGQYDKYNGEFLDIRDELFKECSDFKIK